MRYWKNKPLGIWKGQNISKDNLHLKLKAFQSKQPFLYTRPILVLAMDKRTPAHAGPRLRFRSIKPVNKKLKQEKQTDCWGLRDGLQCAESQVRGFFSFTCGSFITHWQVSRRGRDKDIADSIKVTAPLFITVSECYRLFITPNGHTLSKWKLIKCRWRIVLFSCWETYHLWLIYLRPKMAFKLFWHLASLV